ncbi:hypothetical protein JOC54_003057 [Alkalihalobacillus xiaoxiensis]|uniref:DUF4179 domain-containing protein n=1 Tax=Shouchella xiaoxiensis TaxID=766895 RepID=A0ABS2SW66_9BACI|nr:DUF4179 domain-containing protein [Shouchella xiaoxiensis]MBM7839777.1 hypothetical protein [Shouchella xiaoxiensis]
MKKQSEDMPQGEVRTAIRAGIARAQAEGIQPIRGNKKGRRKMVYVVGSVAAAFGLLIGTAQYSPALASGLAQIPIIGSIFGDSDVRGLQVAHQDGLTKQIGETQTINGISVTLEEVFYDQSNLSVSLLIEGEKKLNYEPIDMMSHFTIDGQTPASSTGSYSEEELSETTRSAIVEMNVTDEMPDAFELGLMLQAEDGEAWYFSTPVEKLTDIQTVAVNHSQTVDGVTVNVPELSLSKTGLSLTYKGIDQETDFDLSRGGFIEFVIVDQNNKRINGLSGGVSGNLMNDQIEYKSIKQFDPLDESVTELTITPQLLLPTDGGGVEYDEDGNERELEFKGDLMKPIEFESFKVKVN